ncbi:MAG TPA: EFR1 family ferrodoxin [Clostridia bacterium]|nr:EFR1 family ferrodoxin [Clostridia bacterium]
MNTQIFYFTGTGNSLYVGRKIAEKLGNASLIPMVSLLHEKETFAVNANVVGFVFPVYFLRMPDIIKEALDKCSFREDAYFFAAVTSGGDSGNTLFGLNEILKTKGSRLNYGIEIPLGDNSIALSTPDQKFHQRLKKVDEILDRLTKAVKLKEINNENHIFTKRYSSSFTGNVTYFAMAHYYNFKKQKVDISRCINCGLCQTICPVDNITCKEGEVCMGKQCKWCFACINYCPNQAISFGRIHPLKETQYHFPGISAIDIASQKTFWGRHEII